MANNLPYFCFYPRDWKRDTWMLSRADKGLYFDALCAYWENEGPIPENKLVYDLRLSAAEWEDMRPTLEPFFRVKDGVWHHKRMDADFKRASSTVDKARKAAQARWGNRKENKQLDASALPPDNASKADAMQSQSEPNAIKGNEIKGNKKKEKESRHIVPPTLEMVVKYYSESDFEHCGPNEFFDFNEQRGWMLNRGKPVKDWQAAYRQLNRMKGQDKEQKKKQSESITDKAARLGITAKRGETQREFDQRVMNAEG